MLLETRDPGDLDGAFDDTWVLKPNLGRVGEGVAIEGITPRMELLKLVQAARRRPEEWVLQKRFATLPVLTETRLKYPCIGVFTVGGKAAGFYGRMAESPIINQNAQDVALLIQSQPRGRAA